MTIVDQTRPPTTFTASAIDFEDRVRESGWGFWRGFVIGCLATATITYPVVAALFV